MLFLGTYSSSIEDHKSFHPTVILPVDHLAIRKLFKKQGSDEEAANSFVDKTFDATFNVTEPVMSDWRNFLRTQIQHALGASVSRTEVFQIVRLLEKLHSTEKGFKRTPRKLNKLVNKVSALWLQWAPHNLHILSVAYYAIYQSAIEENLLEFVLSENADLAPLVKDWQREICAIHYGVSPEKSAQVLIKGPLFEAIRDNSFEDYEPLAQVPGFGDTFASICSGDEFELDNAEETFNFYLNAGNLLSKLPETRERIWTAHSWRNLGNLLSQFALYSTISPNTQKRLANVIPHLSIGPAKNILSGIRQQIEARIGPELTKPEAAVIGELTKFLISFSETNDFEIDRFRSNLGATDALNVIAAFENYPEVWQLLELRLSEEEFSSEIVKAASNPENRGSLPQLLNIISSPTNLEQLGLAKIDWQPIRSMIVSAASNPASQPALQGKVLGLLVAMFNADSSWSEPIGQLADAGHLNSRINDALTSNDIEEITSGLSLLISLKKPINDPPNSNWPRFQRENKGYAQALISALHRVNGKVILEALLGEYSAQPSSRNMIRSLVGHQIKHNCLGNVYLDRFAAKPNSYYQLVPYGMRDQFIDLLSTYNNFETTALGAPWSSALHQISKFLRDRDDGKASDITAVLISRLESDPEASFLPAIRTGAEPYEIITEFLAKEQINLGIKSSLSKALISYIDEMHEGTKKPIRRWFTLLEKLNPYARSSAISSLAAALSGRKFGPILSEIIIRGGEPLMKQKVFVQNLRETFDNVLYPLLNSKDGRAIIKQRAKIFDKWLSSLDSSMKSKIGNRLGKMENSRSAEQNDFAAFAKDRWF